MSKPLSEEKNVKPLLERITQGNWIVRNRFWVKCDGFEVRPVGFDREENEANAELISKAPSLLKENEELKEKVTSVLFETQLILTHYEVSEKVFEKLRNIEIIIQNLLNSTNNAAK
jgi:hypothetical protein